MSFGMLGSPREDLFGIVHDFVTKLQNGVITAVQAKRFLRRENANFPPTIFVTSDGRNGEAFMRDLDLMVIVSDTVKKLFRSLNTTAGATYKLVVMKPSEFKKGDRTFDNLLREAARRQYRRPPYVVAFLLRELLTSVEFGEIGVDQLVVMHDLTAEVQQFLTLGQIVEPSLTLGYQGLNLALTPGTGFVFLAPKQRPYYMDGRVATE